MKYQVIHYVTETRYYDVEAESEREAIFKAENTEPTFVKTNNSDWDAMEI